MFLDHVEKLFPQVFSMGTDLRSYEIPHSSASQTSSSSSFTGSPQLRSYRLQERHNIQRNVGTSRPSSGKRNRNRDHIGRYARKAAAPITTSASSRQLSTHRPKRRGSLLDYHDNTLIPPSITSHKPHAPDDTQRGSFKFTDDDKVFFIHFLRWRLREGDVPEKDVLYEELAEETPHHDADSWRKHWDSAPSLPDRIYIDARKRAVANGAMSTANSSGGESDTGADWGLEDEAPPSTQVSSRLATTRLHQRITDEDLRKMAEFLVEKRLSVHNQSQSELWREFYSRLENKKRRTYNGWRGAARYYESQIQQYVDEITAGLIGSNADHDEREGYHRMHSAEDDTPSHPSGSTTSTFHGPVDEVSGSSVGNSLKRSISESESAVEGDEKRVKVELIDLTD
ncbi:hypothetical protein K466DRAFT_581468 [Polyporus arcularius HHB13444]|uniref:Uncharacterized protein n=1 Tax=Polyporus arcularius HHB13444 TaxID=1314778 RepID=A0A5C3Q374_9APHY|nr:hypothetical protein K466DRAFT_581468 [Polyporus arcularius HHB13444]